MKKQEDADRHMKNPCLQRGWRSCKKSETGGMAESRTGEVRPAEMTKIFLAGNKFDFSESQFI